MVSPIIEMTNTRKHSGVSGIPTQLLVNHTLECPLRGGYAQSLTNWANTTAVEASWHWASDPIAIVSMVPAVYSAWHASEANPMSEGFEQAGYARFTRGEWLTPEGRKSIDNHAWIMAQRMIANNIPHKWLSTWEVEQVTKHGNRSIKGLCNHRQIDPETRTDPGNNYPFDYLDERIAFHLGGSSEKEWFEMPLDPETKVEIYNTVWNGAPGAPLLHNYRLGRGEWPSTTLGALEARIQNEILGPVTANLLGAIKAVSGGEAFDEAKLLEGIKATVTEATRLGVEQSIESIEKSTTINIKEG